MFQRQEFSDRFKSPCQSDNRQLSVWHLSYPSDLAFCPSLPTHSFLIRYKFTEQTQHRLPDRSRVRGGGHGEGHGEGGREGQGTRRQYLPSSNKAADKLIFGATSEPATLCCTTTPSAETSNEHAYTGRLSEDKSESPNGSQTPNPICFIDERVE